MSRREGKRCGERWDSWRDFGMGLCNQTVVCKAISSLEPFSAETGQAMNEDNFFLKKIACAGFFSQFETVLRSPNKRV